MLCSYLNVTTLPEDIKPREDSHISWHVLHMKWVNNPKQRTQGTMSNSWEGGGGGSYMHTQIEMTTMTNKRLLGLHTRGREVWWEGWRVCYSHAQALRNRKY